MITAVNMANKNNSNAKTNVNFKGLGHIVEEETVRYALTPSIRDQFLSIGLPKESTKGLEIFQVITDMIQAPAGKYYPKLIEKIGAINDAFLKLRETCVPVDKLKEMDSFTSVQGQKTWLNGAIGEIQGFEQEFKAFLMKHGIIDEKNEFLGVPLKSITIINGGEKIPDNYQGIATNVEWDGGELFNPKFQNATINGIKEPLSSIEASGDIYLYNSVVDSVKGNDVRLQDSDVGEVTANEKIAIHSSTSRLTQISGNATAKKGCYCHSAAGVAFEKDLFTPLVYVYEGGNMIVGGQLGSKANKVKVIDVAGNLTTGEVYAEKLPDITGEGRFKPGKMHIDEATLGQRIKNGVGLNPFEKANINKLLIH